MATGPVKNSKEEKFDAVIFLGDWKFISTWLSVFYLKRKGIPVFFWSHGLLNELNTINNRIKMFFFNRFKNGGFVYDNRAKHIMQKRGFKKPLSVIFNSLDYERQTKILNSINNQINSPSKRQKPYVIFSGRADKRKNLHLLLEAVSILKRRNTRVNALIIGDGVFIDNLKEYAKSLDITEEIIFYGSCYDEIILSDFYVNSIACVIPNAVGLTAIHSLTYGVPVITNDDMYSHGPEVEAIKDGVTGSFFKKGDASSLAARIEFFLNLSNMEKEKFKVNALDIIAKNFTPANQLKIIVNQINGFR